MICLTMKNFGEYIIEKLKVTKNSKELTLGDIYKINNIYISTWFEMHPNIWVKTIDDIFNIDKLFELQNEYTDYFKKYEDNFDPKIKDDNAKELCKIILNIIFSVPDNMSIYDGVERLLTDCNVPPDKTKLLKIDSYPSDVNLIYDHTLLVYFKFKER